MKSHHPDRRGITTRTLQTTGHDHRLPFNFHSDFSTACTSECKPILLSFHSFKKVVKPDLIASDNRISSQISIIFNHHPESTVQAVLNQYLHMFIPNRVVCSLELFGYMHLLSVEKEYSVWTERAHQ